MTGTHPLTGTIPWRLGFLCGLLAGCLCAAGGLHADEPKSQSPLGGGGQGDLEYKVEWSPGQERLAAIEVNTGRWRSVGPVIKGVKFTLEDGQGKRREDKIGPCDGEWEKAFEVAKEQSLIGISGRHGAVLDSVRFHFSDGKTSPRYGGSGGDHEYRLLLKGQAGQFQGQVRGFHAKALSNALTGIGLLLSGSDGQPAVLLTDDPAAGFSVTVRGAIDEEIAPIAGQLTTLFYQCYPALVERFENPKKPAARHITLTFKRNLSVPAYCTGAEISINVDWLKRRPDDLGLLTHELTHVVQAYPVSNPSWLIEGIADYARHRYGPKVQPGWQLPQRLTARQSYRNSYGVAARFLLWLETKHPKVIDQVHSRMQNREFSIEDFKTLTGKTVDELWQECVKDLNQ